jgi:hypothetical protein
MGARLDRCLYSNIFLIIIGFYLFFTSVIEPRLRFSFLRDPSQDCRNVWADGEHVSVRFSISKGGSTTIIATADDIPYHLHSFFGNVVLEHNYTLTITDSIRTNATAVVLLVSVAPTSCHFRADACNVLELSVPVIEWILGDSGAKRNLLSSEQAPAPSAEFPIVYANVSVDLVHLPDVENPTLAATYSSQFMRFSVQDAKFLPPLTRDAFWNVKARRIPVAGVDNVTLCFRACIRPQWLWSQKLEWDFDMSDSKYVQNVWDDTKRAWADTATWLMTLTIAVTVARSVLTILAIKEDLSWWNSLDHVRAVSLLSIVAKAISEFVVVLFLRDEEASPTVWIVHAVWGALYLWKVSKMFDPIQEWPYFKLKVGYRASMTLDFEGMGIVIGMIVPLLGGYAVWLLLYEKFKNFYSYCVRVAVAAVYAFGFLFMLPQLYMNWKLKTVEGMSGVALAYKAVNTFIDDLFAFVMTMPTLHRVACFRDDIVFFVWLWQRHIYPADTTRVNEYGVTEGQQDGEKKTKKRKNMEKTPSASENQKPKAD